MLKVKFFILGLCLMASNLLSAQQWGFNAHYVVTQNSSFGSGGGIGFNGDIIVFEHLYIRPEVDFTFYKTVRQQQIGIGTVTSTTIHLFLNPGLSILYSHNTPKDKFSPFIGMGCSYIGMSEFVVIDNQFHLIKLDRAIVKVPLGIMFNRIGDSNFGVTLGLTPGLMVRSSKHSAINPEMGRNIPLLNINVGGQFYFGKD